MRNGGMPSAHEAGRDTGLGRDVSGKAQTRPGTYQADNLSPVPRSTDGELMRW